MGEKNGSTVAKSMTVSERAKKADTALEAVTIMEGARKSDARISLALWFP